ncbi:MAG: glycosyltransferase family 2 protein [Parvularculaceae bacterium]
MDGANDGSAGVVIGPRAEAARFALGGRTRETGAPVVSIVTPMFNEEGAADALVSEIAAAMGALASADEPLRRCAAHEIFAVDDASADDTHAVLTRAAARLPTLRVLRHEANAGQSRALRTGALAARGEILVTLDGDGQNDPADIPLVLAPLVAEGASLRLAMVGGERRKRQDTAAKRLASKVANAVRSRLLRDGAVDTGCGLKAIRREAYLRAAYFDHSHRYLPALMRREGFDVAFAPVSHRPRLHGASKYTNLGRLVVAFRDLVGVVWLIDRARSPIAVTEVRGREAYVTKERDAAATRAGGGATPGE